MIKIHIYTKTANKHIINIATRLSRMVKDAVVIFDTKINDKNTKLETLVQDKYSFLYSNLLIIDKESYNEDLKIIVWNYGVNLLVYDNDKRDRKLSRIIRPLCCRYKWSRVVPRGKSYYECSSKGDTGYSPMFATLKKYDNKTIEEIYQLDIKGYRSKTNDWKQAKGKPPLNGKTEEELFLEYVELWEEYFKEKPFLLDAIRTTTLNTTITDMFGVTPINQARAICYILNDKHECKGKQ